MCNFKRNEIEFRKWLLRLWVFDPVTWASVGGRDAQSWTPGPSRWSCSDRDFHDCPCLSSSRSKVCTLIVLPTVYFHLLQGECKLHVGRRFFFFFFWSVFILYPQGLEQYLAQNRCSISSSWIIKLAEWAWEDYLKSSFRLIHISNGINHIHLIPLSRLF